MVVLFFEEAALKLISSLYVCWILHPLLASLSVASLTGIPQRVGIYRRTIVFLFSVKPKCMDLHCCVEAVSGAWQQLATEKIAVCESEKNTACSKINGRAFKCCKVTLIVSTSPSNADLSSPKINNGQSILNECQLLQYHWLLI